MNSIYRIRTDIEEFHISFFENVKRRVFNKTTWQVPRVRRIWKENIFKPIIKNNKDKWKAGLTTLQASIVELVLRKQFEKLGYKRQTNLSVFSYIYMVYVDLLSLVFKLKRRKESIK